MDSYQSKALESWYKEGHELRLDPLHPLLGLAGECGELLNLYKKDKYKPDFSWWNCKRCKHSKERHNEEGSFCGADCFCSNYVPLILDELGDVWYYLRILAWQKEIETKDMLEKFNLDWFKDESILSILIDLAVVSSRMLEVFYVDKTIGYSPIVDLGYLLLAILNLLDCPIDKLTELNYQKLNTPSQNGWSSAR